MVYGMTNRMPWTKNSDPRPIWKLWDEFGIKESKMIGYWSNNCPVKVSHKDVLATIYTKKGTAMIAIASWAKEDVNINLLIDWKYLGIDRAKAMIYAPEISSFQPAFTINPGDTFNVPKGKGFILIISEKE
jgi:hypothetical protein